VKEEEGGENDTGRRRERREEKRRKGGSRRIQILNPTQQFCGASNSHAPHDFLFLFLA
jgi:hypothetical protein